MIGAEFVPGGGACAPATLQNFTVTTIGPTTGPFPLAPCKGCGTAYLTATVDPMHPHNEAECAAYKRGYEAGVWAAKNGHAS